MLSPMYITGPDLNQYLVDKNNGGPLINGQIYFYQDDARTTPLDVFELVGNPPNYAYAPLPNPLQLSGVGTIVDAAGNQIALYYYPYDEFGNLLLYYIAVYDQYGNLQYTREAWPYPNIPNASNVSTVTATLPLASTGGSTPNISIAEPIPPTLGGTGLSTTNPSATLVTNVNGIPLYTPSMTDGQIVIGVSAGTPTPATITAGNGITVTNGAGSITLATGSETITPRAWVVLNTTAATAVINNSFNIAMATYNSIGDITLTFTNAMPSANYAGAAVSGKGASGYGSSVAYIVAPSISNPTTTTYEYISAGSTGSATESPFAQLVFFGA